MSHDFNYRIGATALVPTIVDRVRLGEGVAGKRADLIEVAYQHGVYVADRHWTGARVMPLRTNLKQGATPSDIYTGLYSLERLLQTGLPTLTRNDPVHGDVQCQILVSDPVEQPDGVDRFGWTWPVWQLQGHWEDVTPSSETDAGVGTTANLTTINIGGNHPTDPVVTIDCVTDGSNPAVEDPATGDRLLAAGAFITGDEIIIDVPARRVHLNGNRIKNLLTINRGHWMELPANTAVDLDFTADSGTWDVTVAWRNRHR